MAEKITFFTEGVSYTLKDKAKIRQWITSAILSEGMTLSGLSFIFCSDDYLLNINREYLQHDTYTDIITFDNSETEKEISGDIFISIDRIRENATAFKTSERDELHRVMIHGVLHLLGYSDKGAKNKELMTRKENLYLLLRRPLDK